MSFTIYMKNIYIFRNCLLLIAVILSRKSYSYSYSQHRSYITKSSIILNIHPLHTSYSPRKDVVLKMNENDSKDNEVTNNTPRGKSSRREKIIATSKSSKVKIITPPTDTMENIAASKVINQLVEDSTTDELTVEEKFGLGNNQLRELLEQELPVPREDLVSKKEKTKVDKDKVFNLPELSEYLQQTKEDEGTKKPAAQRVSRKDEEEYLRLIQLNPFADADESLFEEEYDIIPAIFGTGKLLNIPIPFLQTGHGMLLVVSALAGFVYAPG